MDKKEMHMVGHSLLRIVLGLMFVFAGFKKLTGIEGVVGMLSGLGFPAVTFFAWVLALSELIFGALILVGFKTKYTTWPLAFVMLVAEIAVVIPKSGISSSNSFFHILAIVALVTIGLVGPGKWAVIKE